MPSITKERQIAQCRQAVDAFFACGKNLEHTGKKLGIAANTIRARLLQAGRLGLILLPTSKLWDSQLPGDRPSPSPTVEEGTLIQLSSKASVLEATIQEQAQLIKEYEKERKKLRDEMLSVQKVKDLIHGVPNPEPKPNWTIPQSDGRNVGTPTLFLSDWHWDEVVEPNQINYVNAYNRAIATRRANFLFSKAADLLIHHMAKPQYDELVIAMGGDFFSGDIHEELAETNEFTVAQGIINLLDVMVNGFNFLLSSFPRTRVYFVPGNHGRTTKKPRFKNRIFENYEWLFAQMLMRHYKDDNRIVFHISDGPDQMYEIYNTRYLLTHGDQFRGGSGIAGALSPLMLGDARKRKRNMSVNQPYDYMLMGHWHQHMPFKGIIVNGSLKGYDEYAFEHNFDFEPPIQAVWLTHPVWGITARWPVYLEKPGTIFRDKK